MSDWAHLVEEAVQAEDASTIRSLRKKAAKWSLPIDIVNACENAAEEKAVLAASEAMSKRLEKRLKGVDPTSDLSFELCCLRDLICSS